MYHMRLPLCVFPNAHPAGDACDAPLHQKVILLAADLTCHYKPTTGTVCRL
jgi:hypothetical protein